MNNLVSWGNANCNRIQATVSEFRSVFCAMVRSKSVERRCLKIKCNNGE